MTVLAFLPVNDKLSPFLSRVQGNFLKQRLLLRGKRQNFPTPEIRIQYRRHREPACRRDNRNNFPLRQPIQKLITAKSNYQHKAHCDMSLTLALVQITLFSATSAVEYFIYICSLFAANKLATSMSDLFSNFSWHFSKSKGLRTLARTTLPMLRRGTLGNIKCNVEMSYKLLK